MMGFRNCEIKRPVVSIGRWVTRALQLSLLLAIASFWAGAASAAPVEADVFVSPDGNDSWSGSLDSPAANDGPVATLKRAVEIIRGRKFAADRPARPLTVMMRGGTYYLDAPIVFTPADSGKPDSPIVYAAYPGERPIISAGRKLSGWASARAGSAWELRLPEVVTGKWNFAQLYVAGSRRMRPHLPKKGYYRIEHEVAPSDEVRGRGFDRFGFAAGDLKAAWQNSPDIEILILHNWSVSRLRPGRIDEAAREIWLRGKTRESWYKLAQGYRYRVDNLREALSDPGEFYLDRQTGVLTYLPKPGEDPQRTEVVAPRFEHALILRPGTANLRFENLTFAHGNWVTPPGGSTFSMGATGMPAAIVMAGVRNISFDRIAVRNSDGFGVSFGPGTMFSRVTNSEFGDLGAGAVEIGTGASSVAYADLLTFQGDKTTASNLVENNLMFGLGRVDPAGTAIWIANAHYNVVRNNEIRDTFYTGIQMGGTLGFGPSYNRGNFLFRNLIHQIGQRVLSDMGGIYTLGISPGCVVSENVIQDVRAYDYGGWGLYADEGSSNIVFERNLVRDTSHESYFLHYGQELLLRHNIFVDAGATGALGVDPLERYRKDQQIEENIVVWQKPGALFRGPWAKSELRSDRNLYWTLGGQPPQFSDGTIWQDWRSRLGRDAGSVIADPLFVDPVAGDYRLRPDSPALKLFGFPAFDPRAAGRTSKQGLLADMPPYPRTFD